MVGRDPGLNMASLEPTLFAGSGGLARRLFKRIARLANRYWSERTDRLRHLPQERRNEALGPGDRPTDAWHSWDATPWDHPWLTPENLRASRDFGRKLVAGLPRHDATGMRYAFVGNLANNMALRALPLREAGFSIDIFLHPQDRDVMSQPGWELSSACLSGPVTNVDQLAGLGLALPDVPGVYSLPPDGGAALAALMVQAQDTPAREWRRLRQVYRQDDVLLWPGYFAYLPVLEALRGYDALFAAQAPYLAYLSGRPYLTAQTGGDLWLDCSRNDAFGQLQRLSYARSGAILATNPWAFAHARRFGFRHVVYAPLIIDVERYAPGPRDLREQWAAQVGGDFFALTTARIDKTWKGSHIALEGFARFAARNPQARLVCVGWGASNDEQAGLLASLGLADRVVRLPVSGKMKVVEYLRASDCVIDQFAMGYYGATALEAMATGTPVIMRTLREQYDALCPTGAPPTCEAATPEEVAAALEALRDAGFRNTRGRECRAWVEKNHGVGTWADTYAVLLGASAHGDALDFRRSPLAAPLSTEERAYHRDMLARAPVFPRYEI
jgi:hypothetical protein